MELVAEIVKEVAALNEIEPADERLIVGAPTLIVFDETVIGRPKML